MPNDLPMLTWAGTSYAMADAHPTSSRRPTTSRPATTRTASRRSWLVSSACDLLRWAPCPAVSSGSSPPSSSRAPRVVVTGRAGAAACAGPVGRRWSSRRARGRRRLHRHRHGADGPGQHATTYTVAVDRIYKGAVADEQVTVYHRHPAPGLRPAAAPDRARAYVFFARRTATDAHQPAAQRHRRPRRRTSRASRRCSAPGEPAVRRRRRSPAEATFTTVADAPADAAAAAPPPAPPW